MINLIRKGGFDTKYVKTGGRRRARSRRFGIEAVAVLKNS